MRLTRHIRHTRASGTRGRRMLTAAALATALLVCAPLGAATSAGAQAAVGGTADIEARLGAAEAAAASASMRALTAAAHAEQARADAEEATARAAELTAASAAARATVTARTSAAGAALSGRYRAETEGPLLARLLASSDPATLLVRLALLERVGAASARAAGSAREAADVADSLREQAALADAERQRIAEAADAAAAQARAEAGAEAAAVEAARRDLDVLYAQLAALRRTSVPVEKAARLSQQTQAQAAGGAAAGAGGAPPSGPPAGPGTAPAGPGTGPVTAPPGGAVMTPAQAQAHARGAIGRYGWGDEQFSCLVSLWNRESGWRVEALNRSSGAYGIPQALPAEKMASAGPDWRTNAQTQIAWGLSYIAARHASPCGAWAHSERVGWY